MASAEAGLGSRPKEPRSWIRFSNLLAFIDIFFKVNYDFCIAETRFNRHIWAIGPLLDPHLDSIPDIVPCTGIEVLRNLSFSLFLVPREKYLK